MRNALSLAGIFLLVACASPSLLPPRLQASPHSAAVAVDVSFHGLLQRRPDVVYFVKLGEADDPYRAGRVMRSNLKRGHYFYLLNAPPGRYTAVAAKRLSHDEWETTMFGDSARRPTEVTVQIGAIAFMGELILDQSVIREATDSIMAYLVAFVSPGLAKSSTLEFIFLGNLHRGALRNVRQDATAESRFLAAARVDLASGGWIPAIDRHIAELTRP